jgi:hypothetical protein
MLYIIFLGVILTILGYALGIGLLKYAGLAVLGLSIILVVLVAVAIKRRGQPAQMFQSGAPSTMFKSGAPTTSQSSSSSLGSIKKY